MQQKPDENATGGNGGRYCTKHPDAEVAFSHLMDRWMCQSCEAEEQQRKRINAAAATVEVQDPAHCTVTCDDTGVTMHMGFADAGLLAGILMQSRQTMEVIARSPVLQQSLAAKQYITNTNALSNMFEAFARQMKEISEKMEQDGDQTA